MGRNKKGRLLTQTGTEFPADVTSCSSGAMFTGTYWQATHRSLSRGTTTGFVT